MVTLIHKRRDNRAVRDVALRATEGCPPQDDRCRMNKIQEWARATLREARDQAGRWWYVDPFLSRAAALPTFTRLMRVSV